MKFADVNKEMMISSIESSRHFADACRYIGINEGAITQFKRWCDKLGVDYSKLQNNINNRKGAVITKTCPVCRNDFSGPPHVMNKKTTCSYGCSNTYFRKGISYNNEKYGRTAKHYRAICEKHHKMVCFYCGIDYALAVHHYDHDNSNNDPVNLIPVCMNHHLLIHSNHPLSEDVKRECDIFYKSRL